MDHAWTAVRFSFPDHAAREFNATTGQARFINNDEAQKFITALPSLGCTCLGTDMIFAGTAENTIEKLKVDFKITNKTVVPIKLVGSDG